MTSIAPAPQAAAIAPASASGWSRVWRVAVVAVIVGGLAWMLRDVDSAALRQRAASLPAWLWGAAAFGVLASHALRAARLHAEWQGRTGARYTDCLQLALLHNAAVVLLPLRAGEAGYPWWLLRRWRVPLRVSVPSLLWLRLQDLVVLGGLSALCLLPTLLAAGVTLALAVAAGLLVWQAQARALAKSGARDESDPAIDAAETESVTSTDSTPLGQALAEALRAGRGGLRGWLCAVANWSVRLLAVSALLAGLTDLPIGAALPGALAGEWAAVLPLQAPAGFGTYEAGVWFGLQAAVPAAAALSSADALAAALVVHLFWLAIGLLAALPAVPGLAAWRPGTPAPSLDSAPPT